MRRKRIKLSKAEVLNRTIDRWQAKQEGAVTMLRKSAEMLAKLHRQRRRMLATAQIPRPIGPKPEIDTRFLPIQPAEHPRIEAKGAAVADALVESLPLDKLGETEIGKANAESWNEIPAVAKAKPVRAIPYSEAHPYSKKGPKRKPKATPGSEAAALHHTPPQSKAETKPESGSPGPAILEEYINRPFVEARAARMKSLGFRSTKAKKTPAV